MAERKSHQCGDIPLEPSHAHSMWHWKEGIPRCDRAIEESRWYFANYHGYPYPPIPPAPKPPPAERIPISYECGEEEDREAPGHGHELWHRRMGTTPCGKARAETNWARAEKRAQRPLPDWYPGYTRRIRKPRQLIMPIRTYQLRPNILYRITWLDGDIYYGITADNVLKRVRQHRREKGAVGQKMASGVVWWADILAVYPTRKEAQDAERDAIKEGNPNGELLNIQHAGQ